MKTPITKTQAQNSFFFGFWREWKIIGRSKPLFASVFLYPLIVIFGMMYMFNAEVINRVPITVVDLDNTSTSRSLIQHVSASPSISVAMRNDNLSDAKTALLKGDIFGILLIPNDFEKRMLGNLQPEITGFSNLQYMALGNVLKVGFTQAFGSSLMTMQAERLTTQGVTAQLAMKELSPVAADLHPVFNPTLNYVYTLVNGIVPTILQIIVMLSIAYTTVQDKYGQLGVLGILRMNNNSVFQFVVNKIAPYTLVFLMSLFTLDIGLMFFFELPLRGSLLWEMLASFTFITSASLCAIVLTLWLPQRSLNYGSVSIFASPAFGFTGLFYPRMSMDLFAQIWGAILPITWYIEARLDQTLRDAGLLTSLKSIIAMMLIGIVAYGLIVLRVALLKKEEAKHA
ncbi:ABC transporter permease [Wohlfahrtiimonas chitiniclastica]|uniref:ABC transporter permease n=1 Tax=Wohlfahrtiimonas chitiniclastica TaxID=400946 RepID=UPI001BCC4443|nr:ABC transporter permease [Wohlfahrtiimonas chitiniclastica]MBS7814127.1 ABC transporter permease [Wohlfahrtiimonas chitiniclastica]MDC7252028.1 membrane protein [Wohlfahrtiimonas chitiniclastica]